MRLLFLDFETYYDKEYSLRKISIPEYVLDDRYETIMCSAAVDGGLSEIIDGPDFASYIAQFDPADTVTVTFNALFDNAILAWRYGFVPRRMVDTMGMARALLGHQLKSASLASVSRHLGLPAKMGTIAKVEGLHRADIMASGLWQEFGQYANVDNILNRGIFNKLTGDFPVAERRIMDLVLRCAIQPRFTCDVPLLEQHLINVRYEKALLLQQISHKYGLQTLMSAPQFKAALEGLGVVVEMKTSPATGKLTPAFAKTDEFMATLLEHTDLEVQALAAARLGHKSTIEESRTEKLLTIAKLPWEKFGLPKHSMPIPLKYGGAHTHRLSGEWGMNMQNMPTGRGSKGKSRLRHSVVAPPGYTVVVADLGQIEARLGGWISGCKTLIQQFANKLDPYSMLAEAIFQKKINRKLVGTPDEVMGFIGKTGILGLGYGAGADRFLDMVVKTSRSMGIDLSKIGGFDGQKAQHTVMTYRNTYNEIAAAWRALDQIIQSYWRGNNGRFRFGPVTVGFGEVQAPGGLAMRYDNPRYDTDKNESVFEYGRYTHKLYGAKFLENIVQYLARIVVMNAALRLSDRGYRFVLQAHDELVFLVPDAEVPVALPVIHEEMTRCPSWALDLPLTADVGQGASYGAAK